MTNLIKAIFKTHCFHLVSPSPWPISTCVSLLALTTSGAVTCTALLPYSAVSVMWNNGIILYFHISVTILLFIFASIYFNDRRELACNLFIAVILTLFLFILLKSLHLRLAYHVTLVSPSQIFSNIIESKGDLMCCTEKGGSSSNAPEYGSQDVRAIDWGSRSAGRQPYRQEYGVKMHHQQCPSCAVVGDDVQSLRGFQCSMCGGSLVMGEKSTIHDCESLRKAFTVWYNMEYNNLTKGNSIFKGHASQLRGLLHSGTLHHKYIDPFAKPGIITDEVLAKFKELKVHSMLHDMELPIEDIRMARADTPGFRREADFVHPRIPTTSPNYTTPGPGKYIPPHLRNKNK